MEVTHIKIEENTIQKSRKTTFIVAQLLLRIAVAATALAATWIMVNNKQSISLFGFQVFAKYNYAPAFRFFVIAYIVAACYAILSLPLVFLLNLSSDPRCHFLIFVLDSVIMGLAIAGSSAATAISYVGKYGNDHTGWAPICNSFGRFCDRASVALICSYVAFVLLFLLSLLSANKLRQPA